MWEKLDGWKTIVTAAVACVTGVLGVMGFVDEATALKMQSLLVPLALIFLRLGVSKAEG